MSDYYAHHGLYGGTSDIRMGPFREPGVAAAAIAEELAKTGTRLKDADLAELTYGNIVVTTDMDNLNYFTVVRRD